MVKYHLNVWNHQLPVGAFRETPYCATPFTKWFILPILTLFFLISPTIAQDYTTPPIITAENITQLQSIGTIDFADFVDEAGEFELGWFQTNAEATHYFVPNKQHDIAIFDDTGELYYLRPGIPADDGLPSPIAGISFTHPVELVWSDVVVYGGGDSYYVFLNHSEFDMGLDRLHIETTDDPAVNVWGNGADAWIEFSPIDNTPPYILHILSPFDEANDPTDVDDDTEIILYAPAQDPEAVVRIGRIPPPFAVTSSIEGLVKLWDLQTGEIIAQAENGTGEPSVFGSINADGTHLAWRDNLSNNLYLLDFATGENQLVAELEGSYMQFMFLTQNADVIIGVNLDFEPNVYAWDVATGERYDLGPYRTCNRVPDMARLSADGTTLVIGCDTGLDIWRIPSPDR